MKKWAWLWLLATLIDASVVIFKAVTASGAQPEIIPFDFSQTLNNIPYWLDSIWYVFNIIAINGVYAFLGYLLFKSLKQLVSKLPNISLFVFLYLTFGALMVLAKERFNIIYPSYLYHPFNIDSVEDSLWMVSLVILGLAALGYLIINIKYWKGFITLYIALAALSYYPYIWGAIFGAKDVKNLTKPNVVYILLDAVRPDYMKAGGAPFDIMPKLNQMIEDKGVFYNDVTVSVGRSFPSAVAILTGKHAINNGARDNLFAKENITYQETLPHILRDNGYQTIAANDAIQFWNIDKDYGFDEIWAAGTSSLKLMPLDIGGFMPLPLLFANTRIGEIFFPYSYSDRNIDDLYDTDSYVNKIERNLNLLNPNKPLFLFMSMELTHTPYADETPLTKRITPSLKETDYYDACNYFMASMNVIDDQLFSILDVLKKYGRMDDTLLIIGSDHGQGFGMAKDTYITYEGNEFPILEGFYGNNGINPSSTHLMLSMFSLSPSIQVDTGIRNDSIESVDIAPTILDILKIHSPYVIDGSSFANNVHDASRGINEKTRFVESGFKSRPDFKKGQSSKLTELSRKVKFDLNHLTQEWNTDGRLFIVLNKDRAVYQGNWALMTQDFLGNPYVFNQKEKVVWPITLAPSDAPVISMLTEWCGYYRKDVDKLSQFGVTENTMGQGYCRANKQKVLSLALQNNPIYDENHYKTMDRESVKSSQFICTREHLY